MWSDMDTLLLLEGLELFGDNWAEISDHVGTKSQVLLSLSAADAVHLPQPGSKLRSSVTTPQGCMSRKADQGSL